jgi:nucleotide-binding universal stress UspA family protein
MAFPYQIILCPVDFDDNSLKALDRAAEIARHMKGKLVLLHVIPIVMQPGEVPPPPRFTRTSTKQPKLNSRASQKRKSPASSMSRTSTAGRVIGTISQLENNLQPDLLVMATHGRRGLTRMFLGSVAEGVLRRATCPVLTIREEAHRQEAAAQRP